VVLAILGAALGAECAGLSMALGAFVLGMMLSGSAFQQRIEAIVGPLKHALLDLFFIAVGMSLDVGLLADRGAHTAVTVLCILALKAAVLFGAANLAGVIDRYEFNLAMLGIGVSMTVTPLLLGGANALVGARSRHEGLAQVDFIGSGRSADDERRGPRVT